MTCGYCKIKVYEYAPNFVKKIITGNGHADKKQVLFMIKNILKKESKVDDNFDYNVADAFAIAVAHYFAKQSGQCRVA